jgi:Tfp pilus assembly protein PilF
MPFLGTTTMSDVVEQVFADTSTQPGSANLMKVIELLRTRTTSSAPEQNPIVSRSSPAWHRGTYADFILLKGAELCEALAYAHRRRVWHCDVKPSNVLLTNDGRALLLDFNLAVRDDDDTGMIGGTLPYMTPEQLQHVVNSDQPAPPIDHHTDLFAFGVTMFQLLTGRLPFPTENLPQNRIDAARQLLELQRVQRDWCGELEGVVSPQAARVIGDCLAFDPQKRPDSAAEVAQQFRQELATGARIRRWVRSHRWSLSIATVWLLVVASVLGIGMSYRAQSAHLRQYQRGLNYLGAGDFARAKQCFHTALEIREDFREEFIIRQYQLGLDYLDAEDFSRARQCFDTALEIRKDFREALIMRGWTDLLAARPKEPGDPDRAELQRSARDFFWEASRRYVDCGESAASLAQCFAETEDPLEARTWFQNATDLEFSSASIANNLGLCFYMSPNPRFDEAAPVLSGALAMDPALPAAHWNLLDVRYRLILQGRRNVQRARRSGNEESIQREQDSLEHELQLALEQIKLMRQAAPPIADLELAAGRIFAVGLDIEASDSKEEAERRQKELLEEVLASCETAIQLNIRPDRLRVLQDTAPQLKEDERFQQLLQSADTSEEPIKKLVDIFPEVRGRLAQTTPET